MIENYIDAHGEISQKIAWVMGIGRLASRIHDMKELGYKFSSERKCVRNRDGSKSYVSFYSIIEKPEKNNEKK
jgi:hypothetical protein